MAWEPKILWFDTETTGVNPVKNGIIQIAGIVEVGGVVREEFNLTCKPHQRDIVEDEALKVHGMSYKQIMSFADPTVTYFQLLRIFDRYIDKYDPKDKFINGGKNIQFDKNMLHNFFMKNGTPAPKAGCQGDPYLFSYLSPSDLDAQHLACQLEMYRNEKIFPDHKLQTMCDILGVELTGAHDAMADIHATREVTLKMFYEIAGWGSE